MGETFALAGVASLPERGSATPPLRLVKQAPMTGQLATTPTTNAAILDAVDSRVRDGKLAAVQVNEASGVPVDKEGKAVNADLISDHMVYIFGRDYLDDGTVAYWFADNATGEPDKDTIGYFSVNPYDGSLFKVGPKSLVTKAGTRIYGPNHDYVVTSVR